MRHWFAVWPFAALAAVVGLGCTSSLPPDGPNPLDRPAAVEPPPGPGRLLGAGGCAARGCHGGPATTPAGDPQADWANASTFWARYDKHALAHASLRSDLAIAMIARLREGQPAAGWRDAAAEPRCLACHVTPQLAAVDDPHRWAEGVSCDACHTLPGRTTTDWLGPHQLARTNGWTHDEYTKHGLRRLDAPARRAEVCVGCHVGAPAGDGIPVREVTHDLIAAGHPRLNFEFVTYLALMPPHWVERSPGPGLPAAAWFAGQVETAKAGLALSADRAGRVAKGETIPWPELAEWNCHGCHHDLANEAWRRRSGPAGLPLWTGASVSDPLLQVLAGGPDLAKQYTRLRLQAVTTGRAGAGQLASGLLAFLEKLSSTGSASALHPDDVAAGRKLSAALRLAERERSGELARMDWDDAALTYYALRAASRCGHPAGVPPDDADRILDRLADRLRLPREPVYNSPRGYDPAALSQTWVEFTTALDRRGR